jgi:hypothetical protein
VQRVLGSGERAGYFIGDGAGMGKVREHSLTLMIFFMK